MTDTLSVVQEVISYIEHSLESRAPADLDFVLLRLKGIPGVASFSDEVQLAIRQYLSAEKVKMVEFNRLDAEISGCPILESIGFRCEKYERVFNIVKYLASTGKLGQSDLNVLMGHESYVLPKVRRVHAVSEEIRVSCDGHPGVRLYYNAHDNDESRKLKLDFDEVKMRMLDMTEIIPSGPLPEHETGAVEESV